MNTWLLCIATLRSRREVDAEIQIPMQLEGQETSVKGLLMEELHNVE